MTNVDKVVVRGGVNDQAVGLDLSGGIFAPGRRDEPGSSDEIEIYIALGAGLDSVRVASEAMAFNVYAGTRDGVHRLNLAAAESDGVDADVTMRGVESVNVFGGPVGDRFVGSGGEATGRPLALPVYIEDSMGGNDLFIGGRKDDDIADGGVIVDSDTLRGGAGADQLYSFDPDADGDLVDAGRGADFCAPNAADTVLRCEQIAPN